MKAQFEGKYGFRALSERFRSRNPCISTNSVKVRPSIILVFLRTIKITCKHMQNARKLRYKDKAAGTNAANTHGGRLIQEEPQHPSSSQTSFATVCPTGFINATNHYLILSGIGSSCNFTVCITIFLSTLSSPEGLISNNLAQVTKKTHHVQTPVRSTQPPDAIPLIETRSLEIQLDKSRRIKFLCVAGAVIFLLFVPFTARMRVNALNSLSLQSGLRPVFKQM